MLTESLEEELSLLRRHLEVLRNVRMMGPIGIRRLAEETDISRSKVRYSLRVLEREGYVEPSQSGATFSGKDVDEIREEVSSVTRQLEELLGEV